VRRGISQVPAGAQVFASMTVLENLRLGAYTRTGRNGDHRGVAADLDEVYALFPPLRERTAQTAGTLSGGQRQMLAIGRALMARPRLLLLDEPSLGLAPQVLDGIFDALRRLNRERGVAILLVEQNAHLALDFATDAYLLETGSIAGSGPTAELRRSDIVARIYLGTGDAASPPSPMSAARPGSG
jgi:branched-chain amino acid transport system ATP-binding protein